MDVDVLLRLEKFFSRYKSLFYKKRETILFGKEEPSGVYFIVKGSVRTLLLTKDGRELTNSLLGPHNIFPILWTLYGSLPEHTFQAFTDVEVKKAPKEAYLALLRGDPDISLFTIKRVLDRLQGAASRLEGALVGNAYEKVANILVFVAENMGVPQNEDTVIDIPLTHQEIADMVGLARETVTVEMDALQKKGFLNYKGRELVVSGKLLKEKANLFK